MTAKRPRAWWPRAFAGSMARQGFAGHIVPAVPAVTGTVYLVTDPGQRRPPMPPDMHLVNRRCAPGSCLESWTR